MTKYMSYVILFLWNILCMILLNVSYRDYFMNKYEIYYYNIDVRYKLFYGKNVNESKSFKKIKVAGNNTLKIL